MNEEFTFLPREIIPKEPNYFVWYTGTLGQAEWLITFSKKLRGNSVPKKCESNLSNVPENILPLLSLEQPDLIVTDKNCTPLIVIEITEQQAFGTNAQQRVARFWSAVANRVPSAYILPLESYQIEKCNNPEKIKKILEEKDPAKKEFLLFCETLLRVDGEKTYNNGITTINQLKEKIRMGDYEKIAGITENTINQLQVFLSRFVDLEGDTVHLKNVPPLERYHKVGSSYYKAYIRKPEVTDSMLLEWFNLCSQITPTYIFKLQSNLKYLFRTNGLEHIVNDAENIYLSYRNLPPKPRQTKVVHKFFGNEKDEIELFFNFVDACISRECDNDVLRKRVMSQGEYWEEDLKRKWFYEIDDASEIDSVQSGDFSCKCENFIEFLRSHDVMFPEIYVNFFSKFDKVHIYKIYNTEPKRGLYDPYSGNLAVRDVLFTRNIKSTEDLIKFNRAKPLVFLVDFKGESARRHKFIYPFIGAIFQRKYTGIRTDNMTMQDRLIWLLKNVKINEFTKEIRCHIIFSDIILVRRHFLDKTNYELIFGVPTLLRTKQISEEDLAIKSMRL